MQRIEILDPDQATLYCPFCGTNTLTTDGETRPCDHLLYVSSSETPDDPWFSAEAAMGLDDPEYEDHVVNRLEKRFPGSEAVLFFLSQPAPACLEVYVLYGS